MLRSGCVALLVVGLLSSKAEAGPIDGKSVRLENLFQGTPYPGYTVDFTVDSTSGAVEVPNWHGDNNWSIDLFDTGSNTASVLITEYRDAHFTFGSSPNLLYFLLKDASIPALLSVTIGDASTRFNDPTRVSFTSTAFGFDVGSLPTGVDHIRLDLTFASAAPEPSTLAGAALALGFACLRATRRRA